MPISLVSIHCVSHRVNTGEQNRCHAHLISTYVIASKFVSASECDVAVSSTAYIVTTLHNIMTSYHIVCTVWCVQRHYVNQSVFETS